MNNVSISSLVPYSPYFPYSAKTISYNSISAYSTSKTFPYSPKTSPPNAASSSFSSDCASSSNFYQPPPPPLHQYIYTQIRNLRFTTKTLLQIHPSPTTRLENTHPIFYRKIRPNMKVYHYIAVIIEGYSLENYWNIRYCRRRHVGRWGIEAYPSLCWTIGICRLSLNRFLGVCAGGRRLAHCRLRIIRRGYFCTSMLLPFQCIFPFLTYTPAQQPHHHRRS